MHHVRRSLLQLLLLLPLTVFCQEKRPLNELPVERLLTLGYQALPGSQTEALPYFEEASRREPGNRTIQEQVGYIYIALGRSADALERFRIANSLRPSDTTKLQIAYLLNSLGKSSEAMTAFGELSNSAESSIRSQAEAEVIVHSLMECESRYPWWWKAYAAPYFEGRFNDVILDGILSAGRYITEDRQWSLFGMLAVTRDTRSIGGALPTIYSDNYALLGAGLRAQPFHGFIADIQLGMAQELINRPDQAQFRGDFRTVASYGAGWYPPLEVPDRLHSPFSTFGDIYMSYGYYSRYANTIGSLQMRTGLRVAEYGASALDLYLRGDLTGDTRRDYYNNIVEGSVGVRIIPDHRWSVALLAELHRGTYWGSTAIPNPYTVPYTSFRLFLIYDRFLCW